MPTRSSVIRVPRGGPKQFITPAGGSCGLHRDTARSHISRSALESQTPEHKARIKQLTALREGSQSPAR